MAIGNSVPNYYFITFVDSTNVFDCRLTGEIESLFKHFCDTIQWNQGFGGGLIRGLILSCVCGLCVRVALARLEGHSISCEFSLHTYTIINRIGKSSNYPKS